MYYHKTLILTPPYLCTTFIPTEKRSRLCMFHRCSFNTAETKYKSFLKSERALTFFKSHSFTCFYFWRVVFRKETSVENRCNNRPINSANSEASTVQYSTAQYSYSKEVLRTLRIPKVCYRVHRSPPLVSTLSQMNPVRSLPSYFLKVHFNNILRSTSILEIVSFLQVSPPKSCTGFPSLLCDICPAYLIPQ
jgi:hypothetical protein